MATNSGYSAQAVLHQVSGFGTRTAASVDQIKARRKHTPSCVRVAVGLCGDWRPVELARRNRRVPLAVAIVLFWVPASIDSVRIAISTNQSSA
jgi:hypothetical protein